MTWVRADTLSSSLASDRGVFRPVWIESEDYRRRTVYMEAALAQLRTEGVLAGDLDLSYLSPALYGHLNPYGKYRFDLDEDLDGATLRAKDPRRRLLALDFAPLLSVPRILVRRSVRPIANSFTRNQDAQQEHHAYRRRQYGIGLGQGNSKGQSRVAREDHCCGRPHRKARGAEL